MTTGGGTLPLRKPGTRSSRPSAARGLRDAPLDLVGGHLGLDADARLGQLGDGGGDGGGHGRADDTVGRRCAPASPPGWSRGPLGHLVAGVVDWVALLVRWRLAERQARRREIKPR